MTGSLKERIVDAALALAAERSWERVRLHDVADRLGISLADTGAHFREKEEIVDAWFDRADRAMQAAAGSPALAALDARERFSELLMTWLGVLAPHRRVARQMLINKLEFGHVHYQFAGLLRVSRTVQWLREGARLDDPLPWRALEETALTSIYLTTVAHWLVDDSEGSRATREFLARLLARGERLAEIVGPWLGRGRPARQAA
jgi:AcrR family transcriptional regulator